MKLKEYVANAKDDEVMHIGSQTGFFFIGTKEEFYKDIDDLNDRFIGAARHTMATLRARLKQTQNFGVRFTRIETHSAAEQMEDWKRACEVAYRTLKNAYQGIKEKTEYIDNYVEITERDIREIGERTIQRDGTIILVDGPETGVYWFREEYQTKIIQKDNCLFEYDEE